jgi:tetratricopeptide (TPR) repeat protein
VRAAACELRRKVAKGVLLALPRTAADQQLRDVVEQYLHSGVAARGAGDYAKSLKKLEKGWKVLQQRGTESADICLELGLVFTHFGRRAEAYATLKRGLQHCASSVLFWQLSRGLVQLLYQRGEWEEAAETAESALSCSLSSPDPFEALQILYFLACSHYNLGNTGRGFDLVSLWTSKLTPNDVPSQAALNFINAAKKYQEGSKKGAFSLYEAGLRALNSLPTAPCYIAAIAQYMLGEIDVAISRQKVTQAHNTQTAQAHYTRASTTFSVHFPQTLQYAHCLFKLAHLCQKLSNQSAAEENYSRALAIYSAHFPQSIGYANCLDNLGFLYKSTKRVTEAESQYLRAVPIYSAHFPQSIDYANCLHNLGTLYKSMKMVAEAESQYLRAVPIYSAHFPHSKNYADCLNNLAFLYESMDDLSAAEPNYASAVSIYSNYFPKDHNYANCLWNLGDLLKTKGRKDEAKARIEAALEVYSYNKADEGVTRCKLELLELRS